MPEVRSRHADHVEAVGTVQEVRRASSTYAEQQYNGTVTNQETTMTRRNIVQLTINGVEMKSEAGVRQIVLESDFDGVADSHWILVLDANGAEVERYNARDAEEVVWES